MLDYIISCEKGVWQTRSGDKVGKGNTMEEAVHNLKAILRTPELEGITFNKIVKGEPFVGP